ncbi:hypothetical protein HR060_12480 [Catenovulum sp. SM1970]|uniref:hypothetical protein n=1 Tax=Marinifaba aquimaris TaxID=2741323 RepID=UPI001571604F|nr:hypothetical protein [Marinifaba aquimaris]NTS77677.1 hypothetical protein [Marinifaba aquimaris]
MRYLLLIVLLNLSFAVSAKQSIKVAVSHHLSYLYQTYLGGRDPIGIRNYYHPIAERIVIDILLQEQAMHASGCDYKIEFEAVDFNFDRLQTLLRGHTALSYDSFWLSEIEDHQDKLYISSAIIPDGKYQVGLFTSEQNAVARALKNREQVGKYSMVSNQNWPVDQAAIKTLQPKELFHQDNWVVMSKLVSNGWVDFMLAPFTVEEGFGYSQYNPRLVPVAKRHVVFQGSRHLAVAKNFQDSEKIYQCLETGIRKLIDNGRVEKMYDEAVFFYNQRKDWQELK